jgi:uncharacterized SAM-binding protein YcdF (DUF218 family)
LELIRAAAKGLIPGSAFFLVLGLAVGVVLLLGPPEAVRWGRRWVVGLFAVYLLLSLQGISDLLVRGLSLTRQYPALRSASDARGADVVVVLSNGLQVRRTPTQEIAFPNLQSSFNALEAARIYRLLGNPLLLVSGGPAETNSVSAEGQVVADAIERLGVPKARIVVDNNSPTTHVQTDQVGAWLRKHAKDSFVLVTAPEHMRRAAGGFVAQGLHPIPAASGLQYGGSPFWWPTAYALRGSESAIYEYVAWCFYRLRGWL